MHVTGSQTCNEGERRRDYHGNHFIHRTTDVYVPLSSTFSFKYVFYHVWDSIRLLDRRKSSLSSTRIKHRQIESGEDSTAGFTGSNASKVDRFGPLCFTPVKPHQMSGDGADRDHPFTEVSDRLIWCAPKCGGCIHIDTHVPKPGPKLLWCALNVVGVKTP